jgi:hypothetical protein
MGAMCQSIDANGVSGFKCGLCGEILADSRIDLTRAELVNGRPQSEQNEGDQSLKVPKRQQ